MWICRTKVKENCPVCGGSGFIYITSLGIERCPECYPQDRDERDVMPRQEDNRVEV